MHFVACLSTSRRAGFEARMEQMETVRRLAGCSFAVNGVPLWGKLKAGMEQMETAPRLAGCSFGVGGVPFWGKLKASMDQLSALLMKGAFQRPNRRCPTLGPGSPLRAEPSVSSGLTVKVALLCRLDGSLDQGH